MEVRISRGARVAYHASVKPHFSRVPMRKLSISTSAFSIRPARIFCPAAPAMLRVSERLLRLTPRKYADSPAMNGGPQPRVSSPWPGGSILITSAPMSPSVMVQSGPARMRVRSTTRSPASGPLASVIWSVLELERVLARSSHRRWNVLGVLPPPLWGRVGEGDGAGRHHLATHPARGRGTDLGK